MMGLLRLVAFASLLVAQPALARTVEFTYRVEVPAEVPNGQLEIFVPLAQSGVAQQVLSRSVRTQLAGVVYRESRLQDLVWHGSGRHLRGHSTTVEIQYRIRRLTQYPETDDGRSPTRYLPDESPAAGESDDIRDLLRRVDLHKKPPLGRAHALFDFVACYMRERRVGSGWGRADAHWAARYGFGDDSDFAALFVAMARRSGIPARLRFGVALPAAWAGQTTPRSWAEFFVNGMGWLPADVAAAGRDPRHRADWFGRLPADRLALSVGLDPALDGARNWVPYLLYPHLELDGQVLRNFQVDLRYRGVAGR